MSLLRGLPLEVIDLLGSLKLYALVEKIFTREKSPLKGLPPPHTSHSKGNARDYYLTKTNTLARSVRPEAQRV